MKFFFIFFLCFNTESNGDIDYNDNHHFLLDVGDETKLDFEKKAVENMQEGEVVYLMLGHPKNEAANKMHLKSYYALARRLSSKMIPVKAASINKDLSSSQHLHENTQQSYWTSNEWLVDYGKQELNIQMEQPTQAFGHDFDFLGIMVHSWDDCFSHDDMAYSICLHVIQIRNYGHFFPQNITQDQLHPVFRWIRGDFDRKGQMPTIVVFQEFETNIEWLARTGYESGLDETKHFAHNLLAVVFSLMSKNVTVDANICYGDSSSVTKAPLISFSHLPDNSYVAIQFNPATKGAKKFFQMNVDNSTHTYVTEIPTNSKTCL